MSSRATSSAASKGKTPVRDTNWDYMPFSRALPIISELLEQPGFIGELKKVSSCDRHSLRISCLHQ